MMRFKLRVDPIAIQDIAARYSFREDIDALKAGEKSAKGSVRAETLSGFLSGKRMKGDARD
jgi:hypothetical protein